MGFSRQGYWSRVPLPSPNGILLSPKKELNNTIRSDMDGPRDAMLNEVRQSKCDITYMWNLKYDTDELLYKTETD